MNDGRFDGLGESFANVARAANEHLVPMVQAAGMSAADLVPVSAPGLTLGRETEPAPCGCGDDDPAGCMFVNAGYPWCQVCGDHHREPQCVVDSEGYALWPDGTRQDESEGAP